MTLVLLLLLLSSSLLLYGVPVTGKILLRLLQDRRKRKPAACMLTLPSKTAGLISNMSGNIKFKALFTKYTHTILNTRLAHAESWIQ